MPLRSQPCDPCAAGGDEARRRKRIQLPRGTAQLLLVGVLGHVPEASHLARGDGALGDTSVRKTRRLTRVTSAADTPPHAVVPLTALGADVDVRIRGEEPAAEALAEGVRRRWHLCRREGERSASGAAVVDAALLPPDAPGIGRYERGCSEVQDTDQRRLLQRLTQAVTHAVIGARVGELLLLHAAALCDPRSGATAVFVAPGNTGKTTLAKTLGPGRGYVTDETVGIRRDGRIEPYPKPLSLRRPDWAGIKDEAAPGELGLTAPTALPWVAGLVLLQRDADHLGAPVVTELDLLDAVLALTPESSGFMSTERPLQWVAEVLERTGGARRVRYAEVATVEPLVHEILSRESPW